MDDPDNTFAINERHRAHRKFTRDLDRQCSPSLLREPFHAARGGENHRVCPKSRAAATRAYPWAAGPSGGEAMATKIECPPMSTPKHLGPIKAIATYELVANQIQRAVHLGLLVPGDRLPAERALAQQLGVARMTVREAIRVLAHEGRITVRRGAHGGMWIRAQDVTKRELLQLAADTDRAIGDVYEFRELVEGASARLAAKCAKPDDVRKLRSLSSSMEKILAAHLKNP